MDYSYEDEPAEESNDRMAMIQDEIDEFCKRCRCRSPYMCDCCEAADI